MNRILSVLCMLTLVLCFIYSRDSNYEVQASEDTGNYVKIMDIGSRGKSDEKIIEIQGNTPEANDFIVKLREKYSKIFPLMEWNNFGPDASYRQIELSYGGLKLILRSWHPLYEEDQNIVATSHGIQSLDGRTRESVLKEDDEEYVRLRNAFDDLFEICIAYSQKNITTQSSGLLPAVFQTSGNSR